MKVKVVNKSAHELPNYSTIYSAGMDLRANISAKIVLKPLERVLVKTGIFIELPQGYEAQVRPRSGLALKRGVTVLNSPGTIDSDYRGEIGVILVNLSSEDFQINNGGLWDGQSLYSLYSNAETPFEWMKLLYKKGKQVGITVFSTPFDDSAVDLLEELDTPLYIVSSFEMTDHELLKKIAKTGKPIILSTGLAHYGEIEESVNIIKNFGSENIAILHCIS